MFTSKLPRFVVLRYSTLSRERHLASLWNWKIMTHEDFYPELFAKGNKNVTGCSLHNHSGTLSQVSALLPVPTETPSGQFHWRWKEICMFSVLHFNPSNVQPGLSPYTQRLFVHIDFSSNHPSDAWRENRMCKQIVLGEVRTTCPRLQIPILTDY